MWVQKMKKFFNGRKIHGINLSEEKMDFKKLSELTSEYSETQLDAIKRFEEVMISIFENADSIKPKSIQINNGVANIPEGTVFHSCRLNLETLEGISQAGLLCSEWFGHLESECEGRFCAFLCEKSSNMETEDNSNAFVLYFDTTHPFMQKLLSNDFFEYMKRKKETRIELFNKLTEEEKNDFYRKAIEANNSNYYRKKLEENHRDIKLINTFHYLLPDKIKKQSRKLLKERYEYDDLILDLFDELISPISQGSLNFHDDPNLLHYYWKAIPGGIPMQLINGIKIVSDRSDAITLETLTKIHEYFPNATILDKNNRVIPVDKIDATPKKKM